MRASALSSAAAARVSQASSAIIARRFASCVDIQLRVHAVKAVDAKAP